MVMDRVCWVEGGGGRGAVRDNEGQWVVMDRVSLVGGGARGAVRDNEGQWVVMDRVCLVEGRGVEGQ